MTVMPASTALVIVDAQYDFAEGGALAVNGALEVYTRIATLVRSTCETGDHSPYDLYVTTQDWHIDPGAHWSAEPDYVDSWPVHCVADSEGASIHREIASELAHIASQGRKVVTVHKGEYTAAYSGCEGHVKDSEQTMIDALKGNLIRDIDLCGVATDYCVAVTAQDLRAAGFCVRIIQNLVAAINQDKGRAVIAEFAG